MAHDPKIKFLEDIGFRHVVFVDDEYHAMDKDGAYFPISERAIEEARDKVRDHARRMQEAAAAFEAAFPPPVDVGGIQVYQF